MASYNELNALIDAYINRNGIQAITGQILNGVLKAMVEQLGRGYTIMGAATPTTDPGTPDGPECYFASTPGTYTDFDGLQVVPGELALLCYTPSDGWTKATIYEGFRQVGATIDGNVGTPSVGVSYANGVLSFDFHNMKGNPGQNGQDGQDGDAAGFGTIGADITGGFGTPGVTVESSGPATAKNLQFHFTNLKGETGVTSVVATVDNTTGNPACTVSLVGQQLTLAFTGLKGLKGDTGVSADFPITIYNGLDSDATDQALAAAQGKVLDGKISQLRQEVDGIVSYDENSAEPYEVGKYVYTTGQVFGDNPWRISGLISLLQGQKITVTIPSSRSNGSVIAVKNEASGNPFYGTNTGKAVAFATGTTVYEYTATEDCRVGISFKAADGFVATVKADGLQDQIDKLGNRIDDLNDLRPAIEGQGEVLEGYESVPVVIAQENKGIHYSYGTVVDATGFAYTKPIWLNKNDSITLSLVGGTPNVLYLAIGLQVYENTRFVLSGGVRQASGVFVYEYTATYDTFVCCCFPTASEVSILMKRVPVADHIERVDSKEPIIVAPFHDAPADGSAGSIFNAETVTAEQLDEVARKIQEGHPGVLSRDVMGKDASGQYDVVRYSFTKRDYYAYKAADELFAWKSYGNALLYTKSFCPVPGDAVYDSTGVAVGLVSAYNSTNSTMTTGGVDYIRSKDDNIAPDVVFLRWDIAEAYRSYNNTWAFADADYNAIYNKAKIPFATFSQSDFSIQDNSFTYNSKSYVRCPLYDFGGEFEHTIVLWGNEHAPQSDPAEPSITLIKMMEDIASSTAESNPLLRYIKDHCKVIFIPVVNPWGMTTRTGTGRVNYNGVNLNRNYDYKWESSSPGYGESKGDYAGDQPEVRYIMDTCAKLSADLAIDVHCLGYDSYINRLAYDAVLPDGGIEQTKQEMRRGYNKYLGIIANGDGTTPGEGCGFVCKNLGVGGGLIEMNAGIPNETLHCSGIMQMNYDFLLKMIRLFLQITDPDLYITR